MPQLIAAFQRHCKRVKSVAQRARIALARNEEGAVTVDWVVITAVVAGLGMSVAYTLSQTLATPSNHLVQFLSSTPINTTY